MLLPAVKTNNRPLVECLVGDIWHILRGLFSPFVLVSDSAVYTYAAMSNKDLCTPGLWTQMHKNALMSVHSRYNLIILFQHSRLTYGGSLLRCLTITLCRRQMAGAYLSYPCCHFSPSLSTLVLFQRFFSRPLNWMAVRRQVCGFRVRS